MSLGIDLDQELEEFKAKLSQTRDKFINKWMKEDWRKIAVEQTKKHEEFVKKGNKDIANHSDKVEQLKQHKQTYLKELDDKVQELEKMKANLKLMGHTGEPDPKKQKMSTETESQDQVDITDLEKEASFFRDNLGFSFKKTSGGRIQFVFTAIDREDPDTPFYFYVKLDDSRKYIVSDCEPSVPCLEDLVEKLNKTNNLSAFVVAMRKAFKNIVTTEKEKQQQKQQS